mmetsp:Transcript_8102/g.23244  ORF Transcript_8102/g.23244 Transcript_8102/m.23244 type:complete len:85 (-) Transcript_8102:77-331(-)
MGEDIARCVSGTHHRPPARRCTGECTPEPVQLIAPLIAEQETSDIAIGPSGVLFCWVLRHGSCCGSAARSSNQTTVAEICHSSL